MWEEMCIHANAVPLYKGLEHLQICAFMWRAGASPMLILRDSVPVDTLVYNRLKTKNGTLLS